MSKTEAKVVGQGEIAPLEPTVMNSARTAFLNAQGKMNEHKGTMGDVIKNRVEPGGCDPKAFKLAIKLDAMSPEKRADFLRSLDQLRKMWDLDTPDMFDVLEAEGQPAEEVEDGEDGDPNAGQIDVKSPDNLPASNVTSLDAANAGSAIN